MEDLFGALEDLNARKHQEYKEQRLQELESFLQFAKSPYYKEHRRFLEETIKQLDRQEISPGQGDAIHERRRAFRFMLDHFDEQEQELRGLLRPTNE